jgi:hypothetical protein
MAIFLLPYTTMKYQPAEQRNTGRSLKIFYIVILRSESAMMPSSENMMMMMPPISKYINS